MVIRKTFGGAGRKVGGAEEMPVLDAQFMKRKPDMVWFYQLRHVNQA